MTGPFGFDTFAHRQPCPTAAELSEAHPHFSDTPEYAVSAHAEAAAKLLCEIVRELRTGRAPEELGRRVVHIGQMMERTL